MFNQIGVIIHHPDGTQWRIPAKPIWDDAQRYYEANGWEEEEDLEEGDEQPTGDELRGIIESNSDVVECARECRWSDVSAEAVLLAGPGTVPSGNDQLWWFEENGGSVECEAREELERKE